MRTAASATAVSTALALLGLLIGCGKSPTAPPGGSPAGPSPIVVTRLEMAGPDSVSPGETARFTVMVSFSDGSSRDVTNEVQWATVSIDGDSNDSLLNYSSPGLFTALPLRGSGWLEATHLASGHAVTKCVWVQPAGTFYIFGNVTDRAVKIADVRVELVGDPTAARGYSAWSCPGYDSSYRLFGAPSVAQVRVTSEGYQPLVQTVQVTRHAQQVDFELIPWPFK